MTNSDITTLALTIAQLQAAHTAAKACHAAIEREVENINTPDEMAAAVLSWFAKHAAHYYEHPLDKVFFEEFSRRVVAWTEE